jgi:hypothetical protein
VTQPNSKLLAIPAVGYRAAFFSVISALLCAMLGSAPALRAQDATTAAHETALKAFTDRVNAYVDLKKKLSQDMADVKTGDGATGRVERHETILATRLQAARKDAKRGDMFGDAAPLLKQIIERDTKTRGVGDAYAAMQEVPSQSPPAVNALYPQKAALATVPPLILVNLPRLPDGLEYRFMGRDLILRDREANVIVDFVPGAVPAIKR